MQTVYLNGQYCDLGDAHISPLDRGFLFADGVYEVLPAYHRKLFRFEQHYERLLRSLDAIDIPSPLTASDLATICKRLIQENRSISGDHVSVYLQVTRGVGEDRQHGATHNFTPSVFAMVSPLQHTELKEIHPARVITHPDIRWGRCDIKATILLPNVLARQQAQLFGADEALLVRDGIVYEAASSNVFIVKQGVIRTAPKSHHLLGGITRDLVIELLEQHALPLEKTPFTIDELLEADEVWLTSTGRQIQPIIQVDDRLINHGNIGALWHNVIHLFYDFLEQKIQ